MSKTNSTTDLINLIDEETDIDESEQVSYEAEKPMIIKQEEFMKSIGYSFRYNIVRDLFEYKQNKSGWQDLKERNVKTIRRSFLISGQFNGRGASPSVRTLYEIIDTENVSKEYDPFKDFFGNNKWDGKDRIQQLINTVQISSIELNEGTKDKFNLQDAWQLLFKKWLVASVGCALGINANHVMLLFISETHGTYKSTWLNNLIPPAISDYIHFGHIIPALTEQSTANIIAEKFICNIDDQLDSIFGKDFNAIKSVITAPFVTNRKSFRRDDNKRVRRVNFVGSVNTTNIFRDAQNRRYLTFEITKILMDEAKKIDMNQVWLQAYDLYMKCDKVKGSDHYFNKSDESIINSINDHYSQISAEQEWFLKLFIPVPKNDLQAKFYPPTEILSIIQKASGLRVFSNQLAIALKRIGLAEVSQRVEYNGRSQPRKGYWLKDNFKMLGDKIQPNEEPRYHVEVEDPATSLFHKETF